MWQTALPGTLVDPAGHAVHDKASIRRSDSPRVPAWHGFGSVLPSGQYLHGQTRSLNITLKLHRLHLRRAKRTQCVPKARVAF